MTTAPVTDGRSARSAKTRDSIADALLDLLAGGNLRPTAKEIAEQASVSVRSVYVHFDDLEDLFCVAANRHYARVAPVLEKVPTGGPLPERARALVEQRSRIYTKIGAVGRATQLQAPFSPTLARLVRDAHGRSRAELERVFAPELERLAPPVRRTMLATLDVLTSSAAWDMLRDGDGHGHALPDDVARDCMVAAVLCQIDALSQVEEH